MDYRHINTFLKVVEKGSFSKAAEALGYTQAAVTIQIKQLEDSLNTILFDRMNRKIYLTEKGEQFVYYAQEMQRTRQEAQAFQTHMHEHGGILRIGTVGSLGNSVFPELIYDYYQSNPDVEVKLVIGETDALLDMLKHNELDLVFTLDHKLYHKELMMPFQLKEPIVFVTQDKTVDENKAYTLAQLSHYPFLLTEQGEAYRHDLEHVLANQNVALKAMLEVGDTDIIRSVLKKGIGISFLPHFAVVQDLEAGYLKKIMVEMEPIEMWCQLVIHEKKHQTVALKEFIACIERYYKTKVA